MARMTSGSGALFQEGPVGGTGRIIELENQIKEQMGERMLPEAALWSILKATEDRGRPDLAQF